MDLISILTTVILTTTIVTVVTGFVAYAAFKLRDKRKPKAKSNEAGKEGGAVEAIFLTPYKPEAKYKASASTAAEAL